MDKNATYIYSWQQPTLKSLETLERIADGVIGAVSPKDVDRSFLKFAESALKRDALSQSRKGFIGRLKTLYQASAINRYGKEIGVETSAKEDAKRYLKDLKKIEQQKKQEEIQKTQIEINNKKILKDILNGDFKKNR